MNHPRRPPETAAAASAGLTDGMESRRRRATASLFDAVAVVPRRNSGSGSGSSGSDGASAVVSNIFWLLPAFNLAVLVLELLYQV